MDDDVLRKCQEELAALRDENGHLREAAEMFGALAERLSGALQAERRRTSGDRRAAARPEPDRRAPQGAPEDNSAGADP